MKIKFLAIIASLFILPLAITSCLGSDNEYELGTDDTISAFALDTIYGVTYKFTIDQAKREIYNQDSVPFDSDTIINKILIKTLGYSGWIMTADTLFIQSDSVDFKQTMTDEGEIKPLVFNVFPQIGGDAKTYKIWVNRHRVDPDSLVWGADAYMKNFSGKAVGSQETKMISFADDMLVYTTTGTTTTYYSKNKQWQSPVTTDLGVAPVLSSIVNFNDTLYAATADGAIYRSIDATNWVKAFDPVAATFKVRTIITTFYDADNKDKTLACIIEDGTDLLFATATANAQGELTLAKGEKVPADFPEGKLSATKAFATATGGQQAMLIGTPDATATVTTPWFSTDGSNWAPLETIDKHALPKWKDPTILYYGNTLYAFGGAYDSNSGNDFSLVYTSINGLVWNKISRRFLFPTDADGVSKFAGRTGYSITIDKEHYIWMTWGKEDEIWRGRLNRLTFDKQ